MQKLFTGVVGSLLTLGLTGLLLGGAAALVALHHYSRNLPDYRQLADYDPATVTRLYDADGRLLEEYAVEKRVFVPISAIPKRVIHAFLSAEDKDFFKHTGVDIYGIARAALTNFNNFGHGRSLAGGSTITQQVVKNFLLTNEKSIERKIKEAILAFRISRVYSKNRILELYLNEIYLGLGSYGVAAASLNYFNKPLEELTIEEAAFLAALPKAPANYDPRRYYAAARVRRDYVIARMLEDGYVTQEEAAQAERQEIVLRARAETERVRAEFFAEEVRRQLIETYGYDKVYKGGLYVRTTLVPELQRIADRSLRLALVEYDRRHGYRGPVGRFSSLEDWQEQLEEFPAAALPLMEGQRLAVVLKAGGRQADIGFADGSRGHIPASDVAWAARKGAADGGAGGVFAPGDVVIAAPGAAAGAFSLAQIPQVNGALLAMDPHSGRVLAMSGGYSAANTEFNRATQAQRQPGSALKPFIYLAGLENGLSPATILLDSPVEVVQGEGLPVWRPQNYGGEFLGPATLRRGLEKSRNAMTVRLAQAVGLGKVLEVAQRFGIYGELPKHFSLVLGSHETTLLKLVNSYAMLASGGKRVTPTMIERIDDKQGNAIYRRDGRKCAQCGDQPETGAEAETQARMPPELPDEREQIADPRTVYQMISLLEGVVERGTGVRAKEVGKPLAGKTGTTNDSRDTWFIGFSPDLVAGIYVGYDIPRSLGGKETGASVALPGFVSFMKGALEGKPSTPFRMPPGIRMVKINPDTGLPPQPGDAQVIWEAFKAEDPPGGALAGTGYIMEQQGNGAAAQDDGAEGGGTQPPAEDTYYWRRDMPPGQPSGGGMLPGSRYGGNYRRPAPQYGSPAQLPAGEEDGQAPDATLIRPEESAPDMGTGGLY